MMKLFSIALVFLLLGCSQTPTPVQAPESVSLPINVEELRSSHLTVPEDGVLLNLFSREYGESIYIDDVLIDEVTPLIDYPLTPGPHWITIESNDENYRYGGIQISYEAGKHYIIDIERILGCYEVEYTGKISKDEVYVDIYSMQEGETVFIDGKEIDQVTPVIGYKLSADTHQILVESKDERLNDYAITQPFEGRKYYYVSINHYKRENYTYVE